MGRTVGEGTFAKVKIAVDLENGKTVAIKILDKKMVVESRLIHQVVANRVRERERESERARDVDQI